MIDPRPWRDPATAARLSHPDAIGRLASAHVVLLGESSMTGPPIIAGRPTCSPGSPRSVRLSSSGSRCFPGARSRRSTTGSRDVSISRAFSLATSWADVWGFDPALYAPLFHLCRDLGLPMIALNIDRPLVTAIGRDGWDALPEAERGWLSPARPAGGAYRRYLFDATGGVRPGRAAQSPEDPAFDRFVRAQQAWDRAFACALAGRWPRRPTRSRSGSSAAAISNTASASPTSSTISASARSPPRCRARRPAPSASPISFLTAKPLECDACDWQTAVSLNPDATHPEGKQMPIEIAEIEPAAQAEAATVSEPEPKVELGSAADAVADAVTATQQEALEGIETASAAVLAGMGSVQREIAGFVADRLRSDLDAQSALLRCRTFSEVHSVQTEFLRTAYDQYATEASRLVRLGGAMLTRSLDRGAN